MGGVQVIAKYQFAVGCGGVAFFDGYAEVKRMYTRPAPAA
jgi:hypothetical protein